MKAFAGDKINVNQKFKFHLGRVESIVEKGENAGYQILLKVFHRLIKSTDCKILAT